MVAVTAHEVLGATGLLLLSGAVESSKFLKDIVAFLLYSKYTFLTHTKQYNKTN